MVEPTVTDSVFIFHWYSGLIQKVFWFNETVLAYDQFSPSTIFRQYIVMSFFVYNSIVDKMTS